MPGDLKICKRCGQEKPITEFHLQHWGNGKYGRRAYCKVCRTPNDREKRKDYDRNYQLKVRAIKKQPLFREAICYNCLKDYTKEHGLQKYCCDNCKKEVKRGKGIKQSKRIENNIKAKRKWDEIGSVEYKKYRVENIQKERKKDRLMRRKKIRELQNCYIKNRLTDKSMLKHSDIPEELIELKRLHLKTIRELREISDDYS